MRALVLSGGGNRGALQAGAIEALVLAGLDFDMIVGSSVGAVNGALLAAGASPARASQLLALWQRLSGRQVFPGNPLTLAGRILLRAPSLYSNEGLRRLLEDVLPYRFLESAAVPLTVVACDLRTGAPRLLEQGPVVQAVLASAAIPGIYPPVRWPDGTWLVDGGIVAGVPVIAAVDAGADEVWALDTMGPCTLRDPPRLALDVANQAVALMGHARNLLALAAAARQVRLRHLVLHCSTDHWFSDFSASAELVEEGRRLAEQFLAQDRAPGPS